MSTVHHPRGLDDFGREPRERYGDDSESRHGQYYRGGNRRHGEGDRHRVDPHARQHELALHEYGPRDFQDPETLDQDIIVRGRVTRIEPYGAFIDFVIGRNRHHRGLAHISQLTDHHIERVEDAVQLHQVVFATVLEIQQGGPRSNPRIRLGLKGIDQTTGKGFGASGHGTQDRRMPHRAADRLRMFRDETRNITWRQKGHAPSNDRTVLVWSRSPSPPSAKALTKPESDSDIESSSESSSSSSSSSSEESRRRYRKGHSSRRSGRSKDRRSSRSRRSKRRRSPSSSESSSSGESDSESSRSSSKSSKSRDEKRARKESVDDTRVSAEGGPAMDDDDLREATDFKGAIQGHEHDDSDDEEEGPMPLAKSNAAAGGAAKNQYGGALLPGEGQALAQYVQQNLRIPRRGEIGYTADAIDKYEQSGFVMSGSRHARMNAVRIRKENQVYSAEEQRALALITMEENQQKEAQLLQDFRTMLKEKQKVRERPKEDKADGDS